MKDRKLLNIELGRVSPEQYKDLPESGVCVVLDNIRSAHNVGSVFRSADSFKVDKVWLCGICAVPPSPEIHKSALGAEFSVDWVYEKETMDAVRKLKEDGYVVLSVEQTVNSIKLDKFVPEPGKSMPWFWEMRWMASSRRWWMRPTAFWRFLSSARNIP